MSFQDKICPECHGWGFHTQIIDVTCPKCHGTEYEPDGKLCSRCHGNGTISIRGDQVQCKRCGGRGKIRY